MNCFDAVRRTLVALESLSVKDVLVGALATNVYSIPRSTKDADNHEQLDWKYIFGWTELHGTTPLLRQLCTEVLGLRRPPE
jgi:hypothetical protein